LTVLDGKVEVESGGAHVRAVLAQGETPRYRADQPHAIRNPFDASALVVVVVTSAMHAVPATNGSASPTRRRKAAR
jgi:hypothetical protein